MERFRFLGLNHERADAEQLARLSRPTGAWLESLRTHLGAEEILYLATCNRVELYLAGESVATDPGLARKWLSFVVEDAELERRLEPLLEDHRGEDALRHALRVVCGFDSLVFGDAQIAGQWRRALQFGREHGQCGRWLGMLADEALRVARRVRAGLDFGDLPTSVAEVAARAVRSHLRGEECARVVVLGAGEMARKLGARLAGWRRVRVHFVNRSPEGAEALAQRHGGTAESLASFAAAPTDFDILIAAAGSEVPLLGTEQLGSLPARPQPRLLLDLGMPANLHPALAALDGFELQDVLQLGSRVDSARDRARALEAEAGHHLEDGLRQIRRRILDLELSPTADHIQRQMRERVSAETERWLDGPLAHLAEADRGQIQALADRLTQVAAQLPLSSLRALLRECPPQEAVRAVQSFAGARADRSA